MINKKKDSVKTVAVLGFREGEVVWAKLRGSVHWPARIEKMENGQYEIYWFNDGRLSKVNHSQLFKFESNFKEFAKLFKNRI